MNTDQFRDDLRIDVNALDVAAATQADLFFYWAEKSAKTKTKYERTKQQLDLLRARLQLEARESPEKFGLVRVTEAAITAVVEGSETVIEKVGELLRAREDVLVLEQCVAAMDQRKKMICELISLHGLQYFAGPSTPRNIMSAYKDHAKRREEDLRRRQQATLSKRASRQDKPAGKK